MQKIFLILFTIPFIYRFFFWSYVFQLKEYRFDRLKEYLQTPQWKNALFSKFLLPLEILLLVSWISLFFFENENLKYFIFWILSIFNLIYIFKFLKNNIFLPKFTFRYLLIYLISISFIWLYSYFFFHYFFYILILVFPYLLIFLSNFLILPYVKFSKWLVIKRASKKSKKFPNLITIWITWSYWKSSVKEYLAFLLSNSWKTLSTPENINTEIWVSRVILNKLDETYKYFVCEMWAYKIWEIKLLWEIVNHKYWFLTAIWTQHIAIFWNQENIKIWKSEISKSVLKNNWTLYINWDNENIRNNNFLEKWINIVKYWNFEWSDASFSVNNFENSFLNFDFIYKWVTHKLKTNLLWDHNILNLTWVLAFLVDIWIDIKSLKESLTTIPKPKHTLDVINHGDFTLIDDTYNLSVDGLYAWIDILKYFNWNKILVLDDILELWKNSDAIHFWVWEYVWKSKVFDKVLYVWTNYKKSFYNWLKYAFFNENNIIKSLDEIYGQSVILFEWRKARNYLEKILTK